MYQPDNWVILKITINPKDIHYRVLGGWSGGYLDGDSWRLNSGITKVEDDGDYLLFHGYSGSVYKCYKGSYVVRMNCSYPIQYYQKNYPDKVKVMPEDTDWFKLFNGV